MRYSLAAAAGRVSLLLPRRRAAAAAVAAKPFCDAHARSAPPQSRKSLVKALKSGAVTRQLRVHKKLVKARKNITVEDEDKIVALQLELQGLYKLEEALSQVETVGLDEVTRMAAELGVSHTPGKAATSAKKQAQQPARGPRLPYRAFTSAEGIEIYVGRSAKENDLLSLKTAYRHPNEWWLHAAGCPGSHVVIKSKADPLPVETVKDAAVLAAKYSKFGRAGTVAVSITRCRNVSKSKGAPAGQVLLTGDVKNISVNMRAASNRLDRLEGAC